MVRIDKGECNFYGECPVPNLGCTDDCCIKQIFEERNAAEDEVRNLQKQLANVNNKECFDCGLSLTKAENKLRRAEETCSTISRVPYSS